VSDLLGVGEAMVEQIELIPDENPRWTICRAAIGREPLAWEFSLWITRRWTNYATHIGVKRPSADNAFLWGYSHGSSTAEIQAAFDAWLKAAVEAGKYRGVDL